MIRRKKRASAWLCQGFKQRFKTIIKTTGLFLIIGLIGNTFISVPEASAQTWTKLAPTGGPPAARNGHTSVYDPTNNRMIVFGGDEGISATLKNDVWVLENANGAGGTPNWTQLAPTGGPPSARIFHSATYDSSNNRMTVFGGNNNVGFCNATLNDVWVLENANGVGGTPHWTELTPTGDPGEGLPKRRHQAATLYDEVNNRMILTTGNGACLPPADGEAPENSEVWVLENANGLGGTPQWTLLTPTGGPPPARGEARAVYDDTNNRLILLSGCGPSGCPLSDVWVLENANGLGGTPNWIELFPTGTGPLCRGCPVVYQPANNTLILFAGQDSNLLEPLNNNVWVLENANGLAGTPNWNQLSPTADPVNGLPVKRRLHTTVLDSANNRMIAFGGLDNAVLNDVWVLSDATGDVNQPPEADAGEDQVVECTSADGATVDLDGTGSSDPDGDDLTYSWTNSFGTVNGVTPTVTLPVGEHHITLVVNDGQVDSAEDTVKVVVQDTTPPEVTANLVPIGEVDDDEGRFRVEFSCSDACDANPTLTSATLNGIAVSNGQVVELELDDDGQEVEFEDGMLEIEAPSFLLTVECTDSSGNTGTANATPTFALDDDEEKDD